MELLLVVVLLGVAAAVTVPNFVRSTAGLRLRSAAEELAYVIRYGQMRAMAKSRLVRLQVDSAGYWLEEISRSDEEETSAGSESGFERIRDRRGRRVDLPSGVFWAEAGTGLTISRDGRMTPADMRLCGPRECLVVSTGRQRGQVNIVEMEETEETRSP